MNIPPVLTAEAVLKAKAGGLSLLDATVEVTAGNKRKFCADPANIKKAVDEFKKAGFTVTFVGKISIGIMGSTALFQQKFDLVFVLDDDGYITTKNATRTGFFQPKGFLESDLEGIVLNQQNEQYQTYYGSDPPVMDPTKICRYTPADVPVLLGFNSVDQFNAVKISLNRVLQKNDYNVIVNVLDSGFYRHSYFSRYQGMEVTTMYDEVAAEKYWKEMNDVEAFLIDLETILMECQTEDITQNETYKKVITPGNHPLVYVVEIENVRTKTALQKFINEYYMFKDLDALMRQISTFRNYSDDESGHGTRVIANLFPILELIDPKRLKIRLHRDTPGFGQNEFFKRFDVVNELKIQQNELHIITCSYGTLQRWANNKLPDNIQSLQRNIGLIAQKAIIVFSSGNRIDDGEKMKTIQAQLKDVISVGGAYANGNEVIASSFAHGYISDFYGNDNPRIVPDICGLCGPHIPDSDFDGGVVWLPYFDINTEREAWLSSGGTSYAAPQVAAVCAILKMLKPDLDSIDLKAFFASECDRITNGNFYSPIVAETVDATRRGLVNIRKSMIAVCELLKSKQQ